MKTVNFIPKYKEIHEGDWRSQAFVARRGQAIFCIELYRIGKGTVFLWQAWDWAELVGLLPGRAGFRPNHALP